jgi:hypothetical protein
MSVTRPLFLMADYRDMTGQRLIAGIGLLICLSQGAAWGGAPQQVRLKWSELDSRIANKKIAIALPGGTAVEGKVRAVQPDGLRLKISKTSNRGAQPKGEHVIPREAVSVVRVTESRWRGKLLGALGAAALAGGIVAAQDIDIYEGTLVVVVPLVTAAGIAGAGIGGYYIGKKLDTRVTEITVIRD